MIGYIFGASFKQFSLSFPDVNKNKGVAETAPLMIKRPQSITVNRESSWQKNIHFFSLFSGSLPLISGGSDRIKRTESQEGKVRFINKEGEESSALTNEHSAKVELPRVPSAMLGKPLEDYDATEDDVRFLIWRAFS